MAQCSHPLPSCHLTRSSGGNVNSEQTASSDLVFSEFILQISPSFDAQKGPQILPPRVRERDSCGKPHDDAPRVSPACPRPHQPFLVTTNGNHNRSNCNVRGALTAHSSVWERHLADTVCSEGLCSGPPRPSGFLLAFRVTPFFRIGVLPFNPSPLLLVNEAKNISI